MSNTRTRTMTADDLDALLEIGGVIDFEAFIGIGQMKMFVQIIESVMLPSLFANSMQRSRERTTREEVAEWLQHWTPVTLHLEAITFHHGTMTDSQKAEWAAWKMRDCEHYSSAAKKAGMVHK